MTTKQQRNRWRGEYGEKRLARKVKGKVVGRSKAIILDSGTAIKINQNKPPDVVTEVMSFESKWLVHIPANIRKIMEQAALNCPEGLTPIGVIGDRQQHKVYYIMMEEDFLQWHIG